MTSAFGRCVQVMLSFPWHLQLYLFCCNHSRCFCHRVPSPSANKAGGGAAPPGQAKPPVSDLHGASGSGNSGDIPESRRVTTGAALWPTPAHEWGSASPWGAAPQPQPAKCHIRDLLSGVRAPGVRNGGEPPGTRVYPGGLLSPKADLQLGGLCPSSHLPSAWSLPGVPPDVTGSRSASCQLG